MIKIYKKEPEKEPVFNNGVLANKSHFNFLKKLYSDPKIYRATEIVNGKKVVTLKKQWHVYYSYRSPYTGLLEKITTRKGINRENTISGREAAAKNLQKAMRRLLQEGYNPFKEKELEKDVNDETYTTVEALNLAYEHKKNSWKESTQNVNITYLNGFIKWLKSKGLDKESIESLTRKHVSFYLGNLIENNKRSNTSRNNHKRFLSSLFSELEEKEIIQDNFIKKIKFLKSTAKKNKPFNEKQLHDILEYTKTNDPYLHKYLKVMWYSFLRPVEITRLKVENINLIDKVIEVETKTGERSYVRIVKPLQFYFNSLELHKYKNDMLIFTKEMEIGYWETKREKSKEDWFSKRFKNVKDHFGLSTDYGVYSFRHTAALSLYYQLTKEGKSEHQAVINIQAIMRHDSEQTTRKYLRDIGGQLPEDWSKDYNYEVL
ncbi:tyrosine-type recombinase/integrase [Tenacibaculum caenipelagi]|uniref:Site-specific recombinase XerD n=1 Tax=Tenacibaculum caenipelagi TaxID=1325435 RepID=A0A4R6TD69_9FLAO|nr:site-specific integrase [Tenacibaculum caenipelagi]TDQ22740.1 site-specific recombinase XerD [Tenacibaculum caenipelagi]